MYFAGNYGIVIAVFVKIITEPSAAVKVKVVLVTVKSTNVYPHQLE